MAKQFRLSAEQIKQLIPNMGGCYASDMITVEGKPVGYMRREKPDYPEDSGWCFFSGFESQDYADDARNFAIYEVNTICNYDPSVIPFLNSPPGTAFERDPQTGRFAQVPFEEHDD
ncbi:MAG: DUF2185 domain-containing protein [Verrucomicrobia bacterium]|nr:DUF2185 domain-containing protein [Verrucomicrobiota bacterium]